MAVDAPAGMDGGAIEVLAAGDLRGEIKPCGCSPEGQMGGLPRRLSALAGRVAKAAVAPLVLDLGNNFPLPSEQGRLKIELIRTLLARFAPEAILPGPNDLALGRGALGSDLPYLVSNAGTAQGLLSQRVVVRAGLRIGLYGYLSPAEVYQGAHSDLQLEPVSAELLAHLRARIRAAAVQRSVLLFRGSDAELAQIVAADLFDLILVGNPSDDELHQQVERRVAGRTLPQVPTKGQGMLRIAWPLSGPPAPAQVDWLKDGVPDHPDAAAPFARYDEAVKALFFAALQGAGAPPDSPYAGAATCEGCHPAQQKVWRGSRHVQALPTLVKVGKQFDPECLACHVVGLGAGGFRSPELTPTLGGVQCENCHGPAKAHVREPGVHKPAYVPPQPIPGHGAPPVRSGPPVYGAVTAHPAAAAGGLLPSERTCRTCHMGSHSPTFDFNVYWPKIRHGRE
ncbi:MAG: cytochrome c family protein [Candidatus Lambdaproteobacteria bacterium]|nr:cytochrome c family protein [Candidatus Lambdaproteobacteria bacterium]